MGVEALDTLAADSAFAHVAAGFAAGGAMGAWSFVADEVEVGDVSGGAVGAEIAAGRGAGRGVEHGRVHPRAAPGAAGSAASIGAGQQALRAS